MQLNTTELAVQSCNSQPALANGKVPAQMELELRALIAYGVEVPKGTFSLPKLVKDSFKAKYKQDHGKDASAKEVTVHFKEVMKAMAPSDTLNIERMTKENWSRHLDRVTVLKNGSRKVRYEFVEPAPVKEKAEKESGFTKLVHSMFDFPGMTYVDVNGERQPTAEFVKFCKRSDIKEDAMKAYVAKFQAQDALALTKEQMKNATEVESEVETVS